LTTLSNPIFEKKKKINNNKRQLISNKLTSKHSKSYENFEVWTAMLRSKSYFSISSMND